MSNGLELEEFTTDGNVDYPNGDYANAENNNNYPNPDYPNAELATEGSEIPESANKK